MKTWRLLSSILQLSVGIAAVAAYIIIASHNEPLVKWTVTVFLAVTFIIRGAIGIVAWIKSNKQA